MMPPRKQQTRKHHPRFCSGWIRICGCIAVLLLVFIFIGINLSLLFQWNVIDTLSTSSIGTASGQLFHQVVTLTAATVASESTNYDKDDHPMHRLPNQKSILEKNVLETLIHDAGLTQQEIYTYLLQQSNSTTTVETTNEQEQRDTIERILPSRKTITELYGADSPVILGLETYAAFRDTIPAVQRMLGPAGIFSTGTNLLTHLLKRNCYIPERLQYYSNENRTVTKEQLGMRWQVPWGKHTPAHYRAAHAASKATDIRKDDILPVVTIRHPYHWMMSMCHSPYTAKWMHTRLNCPNLLIDGDNWNEVTVTYGAGTDTYESLLHLWYDWYQQYMPKSSSVGDFPRLIVRMEDLVFHTESTVTQICECAGGNTYEKFTYVVDSAKADSPGHDASTGLLQAYLKYAQPFHTSDSFTAAEYAAIQQQTTTVMDMMHAFQYRA